ncbi:MAG: tRNA glutamyl-Q(34) synthetase GluQRS [Devosiaceae bacterium]|nr:tRNA glutamyl-Q(34) synthetase GluQRS [Devosiaceae bacterium]
MKQSSRTKATKPILRFAPSPNGFLHLGHAYSAFVTDKLAKKLGGTWLLRIEDIDQNRSKPEFIQAILQDLKWLDLNWTKPVLLQSTRFEYYEIAADRLKKMKLLYPCFCTRKQIQENAGIKKNADSDKDPDGAPLYPGTCKNLSPDKIEQRLNAKVPAQYRLHMDKAMGLTGPLSFKQLQSENSMAITTINCQPERWGDVVIQRKDIPTSYHLSVVLDDAMQNITHVARGKDLLAATDIHRVLQSLLGLPQPIYFHHELITDPQQQKLAKSKGSASLRDLRLAGISADELRNDILFR